MEIGIDHLLDLVKGQERLEAKLDGFLATQKAHDEKLDKLETRVGVTEASISELRAQRKTDTKVVAVVTSIALSGGGIIVWLLQAIGWTTLKAMFAKL